MRNQSRPCWLVTVAFIALGFSPLTRAALPSPDPDDGGLTLPPGFRALVVADHLGHIRFISVATNGDIYIRKQQNGLLALRDTKGTGRVDVVRTFGTETARGTGICVRGPWLYFSTDDAVYRYKLAPGELVPTGPPQPIVVGLPPGQSEHESKVFAFDESGNIYVEVGCPSNASGDPDRAFGARGVDPAALFRQHGGFWRFDANKPNQDQLRDGFHFSSGMRHALSVSWQPVSKSLFVFMMGRDQLNTVDPNKYSAEDNAENPAEEMHQLKEGSNFAWPYTYWDPGRRARMLAPEFGGDNKKKAPPGKYEDPLVALPAHWAPMQMAFYTGTQFPKRYRNGAFVASHGSWNRAPLPQSGYKLVFVPFDDQGMPLGNYEVFADNFAGVPVIRSPGDARYRPCGVDIGPDGSAYVADTEEGRLWRIVYTGDDNMPVRKTSSSSTTVTEPVASIPPLPSGAPGSKVYGAVCALCHMADGTGVDDMHPPLKGSVVVAGDPTQLIRVVLEGPPKVLPANRKHYTDKMPPMTQMTDEQVASVLTYVRQQYAGGASAITPGDVAKVRSRITDPSSQRN